MIEQTHIHLTPSTDAALLLPFLHDADEDDERIRETITDGKHSAYLATEGRENVGAAVMLWHQHESELIYIGVDAGRRGHGIGKAIIAALLTEAVARGVNSVLVGTANAGLANIAFYQKCGFRMDSVRKDYFDYFPQPVYENGIQLRDMLMLRWTPPTASGTK